MKCDHLIYTSAVTEKLRGYQVVAKSNGIDEREIKEVERHSLLSKALPPEVTFKEGFRYFYFSTGRVGISKLKNVGRDEFGRPNRIYTHTIIMSKDEFGQVNNNPFVLEKQFMYDEEVKGDIEPLDISPSHISLTLQTLADIGKKGIEALVNGVYSKKKTIFVTESENEGRDVIRELMTIFPENIRFLCTFSTFSMNVERPYKITIIPQSLSASILSDNPDMATVNLTSQKSKNVTKTDYSQFIADHVHTGDVEAIQAFNDFLSGKKIKLSSIDVWFEYWRQSQRTTEITDKTERAEHFEALAGIIKGESIAEGIKNYKKASSIYKEIGDIRSLLNLYAQIGEVNIGMALKLFKQQSSYIAEKVKREDVHHFCEQYESIVKKAPPKQRIVHIDTLQKIYRHRRMEGWRYNRLMGQKILALVQIGAMEQALHQLKKAVQENSLYPPDFQTIIDELLANEQINDAFVFITHSWRKEIPLEYRYNILKNILSETTSMNPRKRLYIYEKMAKPLAYTINVFLHHKKFAEQYSEDVSEQQIRELLNNYYTTFDSAMRRYVKKENVERAASFYVTILKNNILVECPKTLRKSIESFLKYLIKQNQYDLLNSFLETFREYIPETDTKTRQIYKNFKKRG